MFDLIKLAKKLDDDNIIVTAGILRLLKNKIVQLFNPGEAEKAAQILEATKEIKPVLSEVYDYASKVEKAISDLAVDDYNENILYLKDRVNYLNMLLGRIKELDVVKAVKKLDKAPPKYAPVNEDYNKLYKGTLADSGVTSNDIAFKMENISILVASIQEKANKKEIGFDFSAIAPDVYKTSIIDKIPNMKITGVKGPQISNVDSLYGHKENQPQKGSSATVFVESDYLELPGPSFPFLVKVRFILLDKRKNPEDRPKFTVKRQLVVDVKTINQASSLYSLVKTAMSNKYYIDDSRNLYSAIINGITNVDSNRICNKEDVCKTAETITNSFVIYKLNSIDDNTDIEVVDPYCFGIQRKDCKLIYDTYKQAFDHIVEQLTDVSVKLASKHIDLAKFLGVVTKVASNNSVKKSYLSPSYIASTLTEEQKQKFNNNFSKTYNAASNLPKKEAYKLAMFDALIKS